MIDGYTLYCSSTGVLRVTSPKGEVVSVLPIGTHAALDVFGESTKKQIVRWWREARNVES